MRYILITIAVLGVSLILMSLPTLQLVIYIIGLMFYYIWRGHYGMKKII